MIRPCVVEHHRWGTVAMAQPTTNAMDRSQLSLLTGRCWWVDRLVQMERVLDQMAMVPIGRPLLDRMIRAVEPGSMVDLLQGIRMWVMLCCPLRSLLRTKKRKKKKFKR